LYTFIIKIFKYNIEIHCRNSYSYKLCQKYICNEDAEVVIEATEQEIDYMISRGIAKSEDIAESRVLQDKANQFLITKGCVMMHSAVVSVDDQAYAFLALSGGGKSTQAKLWLDHFGKRAVVVSGDFPVLSFENNKAYVSGTPWNGKEGWGLNITVPLKAMFFVNKCDYNKVYKANNREIINKIFYNLLMPKDNFDQMEKYLVMVNKLIETVPAFEMDCTVSEQAVTKAYNALWGEADDTKWKISH